MLKAILYKLNMLGIMTALQTPLFADVTKEALFANPPLISAKISPDGTHVASVGADPKGISNVFLCPKNSTAREQITFFDTPEIIQFFWSGNSQKILLLKDENGTGRFELHGVDVHSKKRIEYTKPFPNVYAKVVQVSSQKNGAVIGLNHRNLYFHDLYLLDLQTGEFQLLFQNDLYAKFLVSDALELILKMRIHEEDGSWSIYTANDDLFMHLTSAEAFNTDFLSYDEHNNLVYLLDNRFSDTNQLMAKSLIPPYSEKILGSHPLSDVDEVFFRGKTPTAYASYQTHKKWHALDSSIEKDLAYLEQNVGTNFEVINQSADGNTWIVTNSVPDRGGKCWIYNKNERTLFPLHTAKAEAHFSKMYPLTVTARDGKKLICYYTLPKEVDRGGTVDKPIPLVVMPHGGPFKVRDKFEFNRYHQWLASCGYAALSVNFRLSSGFGKDFVNAGNGQWGGKAHLDVMDGIEACLAMGITERGKLAVFGGSYGGYESLTCLTKTGDYFACCVSICGPSNLKSVLDGVPKFWEFTPKPLADKTMFFTKQAFITSMGGNPDDPMGNQYLQKCSPLNYLENIQVPLLLIHGKNDHIVLERESEQIYRSMKARGKQVTYLLFPNEGHRIAKFPNTLTYLDHAERFLAEHLQGQYTPVSPEILADSSGQVFH